MPTFRYGVPYRPINSCTVPAGYTSAEEPDASMAEDTRFGIVCYDAALSDALVIQFQLRPILSVDDGADLVVVGLRANAAALLDKRNAGTLARIIAQRRERLGFVVAADRDAFATAVRERLAAV